MPVPSCARSTFEDFEWRHTAEVLLLVSTTLPIKISGEFRVVSCSTGTDLAFNRNTFPFSVLAHF